MGNLTQDTSDRSGDARSHDPAISAFLYLGEKLDHAFATDPHVRSSDVPVEAAHVLLRAIEGEIIPRLLLAHRTRPAAGAVAIVRDASLEPEERAHFVQLVMTDTAASTRRFVDDLLARGVTHETLFLDLLTHAAQRLGELWDEDRCDFSDVTIGLCRLHEVLREHGSIHESAATHAVGEVPRILLATACADQHVFGVVMVAEFFRRAGWRVWSEPGAQRNQLAAILADLRFDVLGLSAACTALTDDVASEIATLRKASCNAELRVLVGGRLFLETPALVAKVGADAVAADARTAPDAANGLLVRATAPTSR